MNLPRLLSLHPTSAHRCMARSVALSVPLCVPQIRRSMIDGNDGQRFIKTLIKSLDEVTLQGKGNCHCAERPEPAVGMRGCARALWHCASRVLAVPGLTGCLWPTAIHRRGVPDLHMGSHQKHQLQVSVTAWLPCPGWAHTSTGLGACVCTSQSPQGHQGCVPWAVRLQMHCHTMAHRQ